MPFLTQSRQRQEHRLQLLVVRRPQPRHRIPPLNRTKALGATTRVVSLHNILEHLRVGIQHRVNKPHRPFANLQPLPINQRDHGPERRRRRRRAREGREPAVDARDVVLRRERDVRVAARLLRVVVARRVVAGVVLRVVALDGVGLVGGQREEVAEAAAGAEVVGCNLGRADGLAGGKGGAADGRDPGAGAGEHCCCLLA